MSKKEPIQYKKQACKIARQFQYTDEVIKNILKAKTQYEISFILSKARNS